MALLIAYLDIRHLDQTGEMTGAKTEYLYYAPDDLQEFRKVYLALYGMTQYRTYHHTQDNKWTADDPETGPVITDPTWLAILNGQVGKEVNHAFNIAAETAFFQVRRNWHSY